MTEAPQKPVYMFYHIQNDKGESSAHPNACKIRTATPGSITFKDVLASFPLAGTSSFHFRFQVTMAQQIMFLDVINPEDTVPTVNGSIIAKVLRLDTARCSTKNSYGLRLKQNIIRPSASPQAQPLATPPAAALSPGPSTAPAQRTAPASAPQRKTDPAASPSSSPAAPMPMVKPVKAVDTTTPVVVPDVVDEDLADKSDYVKAKVMERRQKLAEEQARRIAEAAERDAALKADQEDREKARVMYGPKLKEWSEEATGTKKNVRLLLSTLHTVLWPDATWEPVPMAKLIEPKRVKLTYMKALTIVHPDKQNTMDSIQKFIATQVFHHLETAFRLFQETEM